MTLHLHYLAALERLNATTDLVAAEQLLSRAAPYRTRRWIVDHGYLSHLVVPVLDFDEEVELQIDEDAGTYSYVGHGWCTRTITRPLEEIAVYAFNIEAWLDDLAVLIGIEPARRSRTRTVIESHLWYLGDRRVGRSHDFAPIYVGRGLRRCNVDWRAALSDRIRPGQGLILSATDQIGELPNGHQVRRLEPLFIEGHEDEVFDAELLDRLLARTTNAETEGDCWFNERTGELRLPHMATPKRFFGIQKLVINAFWKARQQPYCEWSEIRRQTRCNKDLTTVFGGDDWREWIERVGRGRYRIRTRAP